MLLKYLALELQGLQARCPYTKCKLQHMKSQVEWNKTRTAWFKGQGALLIIIMTPSEKTTHSMGQSVRDITLQ